MRHSNNWRKELSIRMLLTFSEYQNTLSTWKKNKDKIFERYNSGLISGRVKPEKYEKLNKALHKWFLIFCSKKRLSNSPED